MAQRRYEEALIAVERATDSEGRPVRLLSGGSPNMMPTARDCRASLHQLLEGFEPGSIMLNSLDLSAEATSKAEQNFLRNIALLAAAAAAAVVYERYQRG